MPNGRSRQTNTRNANRRRNIQQQNQVNAVAVEAPLVIEAQLVEEDISILKGKIKEYEERITKLIEMNDDLNSRGKEMFSHIRRAERINDDQKVEIKALRENEKICIKVYEQNKELKEDNENLRKLANSLLQSQLKSKQ